MQVHGYFDPVFEPVRDAFAELLGYPQERGAALCVQIGGRTVIDIWGGTADRDGRQPWQSDTLVNVFSCTKPFAAVVALQLAAEGKLALDVPVAEYWSEFAAAGKERITLRHLLSHRAGLPALREPLSAETLYDWKTMVQVLAAEAPWWEPGTTHGYMPITYGWLIGELLRRAEGRGPGESIRARVCQPLELDFHVGLPSSEFHRVAHVSRKKQLGDEAAQRLVSIMMTRPDALSTRAFTNPPSIMTSTNKPEWRRMQQPAANGHGNARSLAGFYSALLDGRLLDSESLVEMTREHSMGDDLTLLTKTRFGLGCMLEQAGIGNATYAMSALAFGHPGAGGSIGFADPRYELAFGFVTNSLGPYVLMDPRAQRLASLLMEYL